MALEQIGLKLKTAREIQGLSLAQIYERTKIPINHLQSIDNGLVDDLPEPVYVAGFIKRYADCVGLPGQSLSDEYRQQYQGEAGNGDSNFSSRFALPPIMAPSPTYGKGLNVKPPNIIKQGLFYAVFLVGVLFLFSILFNSQSNNQLNQQDPASLLNHKYANLPGQAPIAGQSGQPNALPGQSQPNAQPGQAAPGDVGAAQVGTAAGEPPWGNEAQIAVTASKHVWVEVKSVSNNESLWTGYLEPGDRRDFKDSQGIRIRAGNGGSVSVEYQGKNETLGLAGKITEKTFMSKTATANHASNEANETKTASATAQSKTDALKKPVKHVLTPDQLAQKKARKAESVARAAESNAAKPIEVPYRYTESHSDNE